MISLTAFLLAGALGNVDGSECSATKHFRSLCVGDEAVVMHCSEWASVVSKIDDLGVQQFNATYGLQVQRLAAGKAEYFRVFALDAFNFWNSHAFTSSNEAYTKAMVHCGGLIES